MNLVIVIPTLNSERTLRSCLLSLIGHNVVLLDGGSTDGTLDIAEHFGVRVIEMKGDEDEKRGQWLREHAHEHDVIGFVDSDNILLPGTIEGLLSLLQTRWAATTALYTYRYGDNRFTRYCADLGGDDPVAMYCGLNDRYATLVGCFGKHPASGSNGFFFKPAGLSFVGPFVHQEFVERVGKPIGYTTLGGVVHLQSNSFVQFVSKKWRRVQRRKAGRVCTDYGLSWHEKAVAWLICATVLRPFLDALMLGRHRLLHPVSCFVLAWMYVLSALKPRRCAHQFKPLFVKTAWGAEYAGETCGKCNMHCV